MKLIAVEGLDGTGKTTLAMNLAERLGAVLLRTPDAALAGVRPQLDAELARSPRAHTLLYAAMVQLASDKALRHLAAGRAVVIDRYFASTVTYDEVFRHSGLPFDELAADLCVPHCTVFLEAGRDLRRERIEGRGAATAEDRRGLDPAVDARLAAAYDRALTGPCIGRLIRLDVGRATPDEVLARVLRALAAPDRPAAPDDLAAWEKRAPAAELPLPRPVPPGLDFGARGAAL